MMHLFEALEPREEGVRVQVHICRKTRAARAGVIGDVVILIYITCAVTCIIVYKN